MQWLWREYVNFRHGVWGGRERRESLGDNEMEMIGDDEGIKKKKKGGGNENTKLGTLVGFFFFLLSFFFYLFHSIFFTFCSPYCLVNSWL